MSNKTYTTAQIEAYLEGHMSPEDAASFENAMHADPALTQETALQKQIIESIKESRRMELKARLDALKLPTAWHGSTYIAALVGGAVVIGVGLSIYFATNSPSSSKVEKEPIEVVVSNNDMPAMEEEIVMAKEATPQEVQETAIEKPAKDELSKSTDNSDITPKPVQPTMPDDEDAIIKDDGKTESEGLKEPANISTVDMTEVSVMNNSSHTFNYELTNNKLTLHGDFAADTYQVLELNSDTGKDLYLKYESNFYKLAPTRGNIQPLVVMKDKAMINELSELSKRNR